MLTTIGLVLICVAWIYQLYFVMGKKEMMIKAMFVGVYAVGVLLLVVDGFMLGANSITWLNLVSLLISIMVFLAVWLNK